MKAERDPVLVGVPVTATGQLLWWFTGEFGNLGKPRSCMPISQLSGEEEKLVNPGVSVEGSCSVHPLEDMVNSWQWQGVKHSGELTKEK